MGGDAQPGSTPPIIGILDAINSGDPTLDPKLVPKSEAAQFYQQSATEADKVAGNVDHDPDYIPAGVLEPFRSMSHQDILAGVEQMKPGLIHATAQAWKKTADATMFNNMALNAKVHKSVAAGWEGQAADALTAATRRFTNEMSEMHNVAQSVMSRIEAAAYGADVVKAKVPPLPPPKPVPTVPGAESPKDAVGTVTTASAEEQTARWAMVNHYVPTYQPAGQQVPTFVPPKAPDGGQGVDPSGVQPGRDSGVNSSGTGNSRDKSTTGGDSKPDDGSGTGDQQSGTDPAATASSSNGTTPTAGSGQTGNTTTAGLDSSATTPAGLGGTGVGGNGTHSGYGGVPGLGGLSGGTNGGNIASGPGRSVPGVPSAGNPLGGAAAAGRGAAAAGMAGMPGMGAPGAKRKGEEDKERKGNPDLLVHERNKIDLIGEPTPAVPPVFGADVHEPAPATRPERSGESDW